MRPAPPRGGRRVLAAAALALATAPAAGRAAPENAGFQAFWQDFRRAVLAGDMAAVTRMSRLPVASHGELDDEPVLRLSASRLPPAFRRLLRRVDDPATGRSVLDRIRDTPQPRIDPRNAVPGQVRVDDLVFERGRDGWRLTTLYRGPDE